MYPSQWNMAFGSANPPPPDPSIIKPTPLQAAPLPQGTSPPPHSHSNHLSHLPPQQAQPAPPPSSTYLPITTQTLSAAASTAAPSSSSPPVLGPMFVSPTMWQESVASVYGQGMKRAWGAYGGSEILDGMGVSVKRSR
jgi:hypothetical protein